MHVSFTCSTCSGRIATFCYTICDMLLYPIVIALSYTRLPILSSEISNGTWLARSSCRPPCC